MTEHETDIEIAKARVRAKVRSVPDFPKPGILFRDITPVLADPPTLREALALHRRQIADVEGRLDKIVGIESRGFLFGMALAAELHVGFVPVRKPGKLPAATTEVRYALEYGADTLQIHTDAIAPGDRVLVVDDLLATGGTADAARRLVTQLGGTVLAALFLIELEALGGRAKLDGVRVETILRY
jgi:adenine phosphoribosyltransferase